MGVGNPHEGPHLAEKLRLCTRPCLPDRSPTWQFCGLLSSQVIASVTLYGSRWPPTTEQLPFDATGLTWIWYTGLESVPNGARVEKAATHRKVRPRWAGC